MITSWQLYWLTRLDSINDSFGALTAVLFLLAAVSLLLCVLANADGDLKNKKWWRMPIVAAIAGFISGIFYTTIPTTKEMAAILIVPKITNAIAENKEIQKLPDNVLNLANEWIEHLKPKEKE